MDDPGGDAHGRSYTHDPSNYELSGKIMVSAIIVLFTVLLFILCLHVYARCFLLRRRREEILRRRRRAHFVFVSEGVAPAASTRGLDASVLRALPVFVYSPETHHEEPLECAVCLSEFEDKEKGRRLPKCNHSFHIECIDMWFHSHSTCPLCRAAIELEAAVQEEIVITVEGGADSDRTASNSGVCDTCRLEEETGPSSSSSSSASNSAHYSLDSSSSSSKTKPRGFNGIRLEVPRRGSESFTNLELELSLVSPGGQGLKSPGSRILSLKRILSRETRFSPTALSCSSGIDLERGGEEQGAQHQNRR
ncbi:hypothetical protein H6P81_003989 [Aristolochia fimbriata]|uniref:RING-type E3 ubiquitin transferase n=1 Tax=Aristolochia fimbriata TaxID=158543 RepID=A0AAV7FHE1_ARIFI|nr:hypothetical protein H6P81_003989 [Aristolochia fimbriata]